MSVPIRGSDIPICAFNERDAPIYANLVADGETFNHIWSRSLKQNG